MALSVRLNRPRDPVSGRDRTGCPLPQRMAGVDMIDRSLTGMCVLTMFLPHPHPPTHTAAFSSSSSHGGRQVALWQEEKGGDQGQGGAAQAVSPLLCVVW